MVKRNSYVLGQLYQQTNHPLKSNDYKNLYKTISDSLFTNEQEQKILILETKRKVKEVLQKKKILELENKAQRAQFRGIIIALLFLLAISCIAVFSYLKVRKKNRLLLCRTIDLAEIQLRLSEKLNGYEQDSTKWSIERKKAMPQRPSPDLTKKLKT